MVWELCARYEWNGLVHMMETHCLKTSLYFRFHGRRLRRMPLCCLSFGPFDGTSTDVVLLLGKNKSRFLSRFVMFMLFILCFDTMEW